MDNQGRYVRPDQDERKGAAHHVCGKEERDHRGAEHSERGFVGDRGCGGRREEQKVRIGVLIRDPFGKAHQAKATAPVPPSSTRGAAAAAAAAVVAAWSRSRSHWLGFRV